MHIYAGIVDTVLELKVQLHPTQNCSDFLVSSENASARVVYPSMWYCKGTLAILVSVTRNDAPLKCIQQSWPYSLPIAGVGVRVR